MDKINFTGIKNTGFMHTKVIHPNYMRALQRNYLLVQLTDDYNGKDLAEFKETVKKCQPELGECVFPYDSSFVNIFTQKWDDNDIPRLFVNFKEIVPSRSTMPLFSYIAALTRRLADIPKVEINRCFKYGPDGDKFMYGDVNLSEIVRDSAQLENALQSIYNVKSVNAGAKLINNDIQEQMYDFFL